MLRIQRPSTDSRERREEDLSGALALPARERDNLAAAHPDRVRRYRACLGLLSLAKRFGKPRLEAGCMLALQIGACQYRHVRNILVNNRDQSAPATAGDWVSPNHAHVRALVLN